MAKAKRKKMVKATPTKGKAKPVRARPAKAKPKAKPAKTKPKAKPAKTKTKSVGARPAKAKANAKPTQAKAKPAAKPAKARPAVPVSDASQESSSASTNGVAPFAIAETSPGNYSLLLTSFEPASEVFSAAGIEGGGYAWEGIARHVGEVIAPELAGRFRLDPEGSMFCAYGDDLDALARLGAELAKLFHNAIALAAVIQQVGRDGFDD